MVRVASSLNFHLHRQRGRGRPRSSPPPILTQQHQLFLRRSGRAKQQHAQLDGGASAAEPKIDGEQLALHPPECLPGQVLEHHDACGRR